MSSSPASGVPNAPAFICERGAYFLDACRGEPFYKQHPEENKRYCVLHYPGTEKSADFAVALGQKLATGNLDFRGVWFPEIPPFGKVNFSKETYFAYAVFNAGANFYESTFSADVYFHYVEFKAEADFSFANFRGLAYFRGVKFCAGANFEVAVFNGEADFTAIKFRAAVNTVEAADGAGFDAIKLRAVANFGYTRISDYLTFSSEDDIPAFDEGAYLEFQFAKIEKAERVSFRTLRLRPHWFVNVDARKFDLANVDWNWNEINLNQELKELQKKKAALPHRLISIACRNLALNAEENHRYDEASKFRFWAMDARRRERAHGFRPWTLGWWYWLASGYGESIVQAFAVLIGIWLLFAALYSPLGFARFARWEPRMTTEKEAAEARRDVIGEDLSWRHALTYSLSVMTLQKPEPRPATTAAQSLVMLETILGPVQAALLALAIRRKFMR